MMRALLRKLFWREYVTTINRNDGSVRRVTYYETRFTNKVVGHKVEEIPAPKRRG
jgi:hypothetical protein